MAIIHFTQNLQRHVRCASIEVGGRTVREVFDAVFTGNPQARGYVLDEQGELRKHMIVFIDGVQLGDRSGLTDSVPFGGEIYVMQALSGG